MGVDRKQPTAKGPSDWFTGEVWLDSIVQPNEPSQLNVAAVHFTPGARTAWHAHARSRASGAGGKTAPSSRTRRTLVGS